MRVLAGVSVFDSVQIEPHSCPTLDVMRIGNCILSIRSISDRDLEPLIHWSIYLASTDIGCCISISLGPNYIC